MTPDDAGKILTLIAVYDNRSFEKITAHAWADALDGLTLGDCLDGVKAHFRRSRQWLMPAELRDIVRGLIVERRQHETEHAERLELEQAPVDPVVAAERAEKIRRMIADACRLPADQVVHPSGVPSRDWQARSVVCPWCKALVGSPCVNSTTGIRTSVTHERRLIAAGLIAGKVTA